MEQFRVLSRSEHPISRKAISEPALKVLYRLRSKGYWAFLVGGALRDLLRDVTPRDYDVATNATIDEISKLFRNGKVIGKRFPIVHAYFGGDLVEISSLKCDKVTSKFQALYEDAMLRDFTVNAIFYDIDDFRVLDPLNAVADVAAKRVEPIGDADEKFAEDPIRMLRAVKLHVKHGFSFPPNLDAVMQRHAHTWETVGPGRRYEEISRILLGGYAGGILTTCRRLGFLKQMWPVGYTLLERLGPEFFDQAAEGVPIHYSRGSYAKSTHVALWFKLFMQAKKVGSGLSPKDAREVFDTFIEPLGMPFRQPIYEALHAYSLMMDDQLKAAPMGHDARLILDRHLAAYEPERHALFLETVGADSPRKRSKPHQRPHKRTRRGGRRRSGRKKPRRS